MNTDIEINGNMELSKHSPLEQFDDVMEENVEEKAKSKSQHIVTINKPILRKIIKETIINYLNLK